MAKEELQNIVMDEMRRGWIVYRTIEGLHKQKLNDFTKQPIEGQLYDINRDMATCLTLIDEPMGVNNFASMVLIKYYHDKCQRLEEKLKEYEKEGR